MNVQHPSLLALAMVFGATSAMAQDPIVVESALPTAIVSYADLDITSAAGLRTLNRRVEQAAASICVEPGIWPLAVAMDQRHCKSVALSQARADIVRVVKARIAGLDHSSSVRVAAR